MKDPAGGQGRGREGMGDPGFPTVTATQVCPRFPARFVLGAGIRCQPHHLANWSREEAVSSAKSYQLSNDPGKLSGESKVHRLPGTLDAQWHLEPNEANPWGTPISILPLSSLSSINNY